MGRSRILGLAGAAVLASLLIGTASTEAAFTSTVQAVGRGLGGAYEIGFLDEQGEFVAGDPDPFPFDGVAAGGGGATAAEVRVVTTTEATGPVTLTLENGRTAALPSDPGFGGPGAEPFDVALFTVSVDGEAVAGPLRADELGAVVIPKWRTGEARTVAVAATLPPALGNPYYSGRDMSVVMHFEGSTS